MGNKIDINRINNKRSKAIKRKYSIIFLISIFLHGLCFVIEFVEAKTTGYYGAFLLSAFVITNAIIYVSYRRSSNRNWFASGVIYLNEKRFLDEKNFTGYNRKAFLRRLSVNWFLVSMPLLLIGNAPIFIFLYYNPMGEPPVFSLAMEFAGNLLGVTFFVGGIIYFIKSLSGKFENHNQIMEQKAKDNLLEQIISDN